MKRVLCLVLTLVLICSSHPTSVRAAHVCNDNCYAETGTKHVHTYADDNCGTWGVGNTAYCPWCGVDGEFNCPGKYTKTREEVIRDTCPYCSYTVGQTSVYEVCDVCGHEKHRGVVEIVNCQCRSGSTAGSRDASGHTCEGGCPGTWKYGLTHYLNSPYAVRRLSDSKTLQALCTKTEGLLYDQAGNLISTSCNKVVMRLTPKK